MRSRFASLTRNSSLSQTLLGREQKAVPLTKTEISSFVRDRANSPVQIFGFPFLEDVAAGRLNHFNNYSTDVSVYERFARSSVYVHSKFQPYLNKQDYDKLTIPGYALVQEVMAQGGRVPYYGNGVIIGDEDLYSKSSNSQLKKLVKTAYHNVARCRNEKLENVDEKSVDIKHKCLKMVDFEVVHPYKSSESVPAKIVDFDIEDDVAILEMEREIDGTNYMNVTKDEIFDDMVNAKGISNVVACAANNLIQFDADLQRSFERDVVIGAEGVLLYGTPDFHCFIGLDQQRCHDAYPTYFSGNSAYFIDGSRNVLGSLLVKSDEGQNIWKEQLATLVGHSGCGVSMLPNEIFGVEIFDSWNEQTTPALWKHGNTGRMEYKRIRPLFEEMASRNE